MPVWGVILLAIIGFLLIASIALTIVTFRIAFSRKQRKTGEMDYGVFQKAINDGVAWFQAMPIEEIWLTSSDGLRLYGRLLSRPDAHGTIVMMHGYHGDALEDFAPAFKTCFEHGWNLLVPDERTHGRSEGKYITYGVKESDDCRLWAEFATARFGEGKPIFLYGLSMGCASVLMASALPLPRNVRGIVADCGYTQPYDIIRHVLKDQMHLPAFPTMVFLSAMTRMFAGFGLKEASAERAMRKCRLPVLFYHGMKDDFVPLWMGNANYAACAGEKEQLLVEGAGHAQSFLVEPERCLAALTRFLSRYGEAENDTAQSAR